MNIEITNEELDEIETLVEEYENMKVDNSYYMHLVNYLLELMVEKGVVKFQNDKSN